MITNHRDELELRKFVEAQSQSGRPAVAVVNPDGSNVGGFSSGATVTIGSAPTLYAVVNTSAPGVTNSLATILNPVQLATGGNYIGLATVIAGSAFPVSDNNGSLTVDWLSGATVSIASLPNVTVGSALPAGGNYIGLATVNVSNTVNSLLQAGTSYVGLASVNIGGTLPALTTGAAFIGLATVVQGNQPALIASTAYIGLASVNIGGTLPALTAGAAYIGLASVNIGGSLPALSAGTNFIGLATVVQGNQPALVASTAYIGLASVNIGGTLPALTASSAFIGLATTVNGAGTQFIGLATVVHGSNVTLNASSAFIGLATIVPTYLSTYTSLATIISASGNATLFTPPNGQRWILKDLLIGSLGRQEIKIISGAADVIPYISLSTTGGYISNFGDSGFRAKAINDAFVIALSATATISITANVRFE